MKDKKKITNQYNKKIKDLKNHNRLYYDEDKPVISDLKYDNLKREILELEKKFPFFKKERLHRQNNWLPSTNKFKKIKHLKPMLSLSNAFDKHDMEDFLKKIKKFFKFK